MKAKKITLNQKEYMQLGDKGDLFIHQEGYGMCQEGAVEISQMKDFDGEKQSIRFHEEDIPRLIKALQSKIPEMNEDNCEEWQ